jgi:hypothetical protein
MRFYTASREYHQVMHSCRQLPMQCLLRRQQAVEAQALSICGHAIPRTDKVAGHCDTHLVEGAQWVWVQG